jgi:hypothetical protein
MRLGQQQQQQVEDALRQYDFGARIVDAPIAKVDQEVADLQISGMVGPGQVRGRYQAVLQRLVLPIGICTGVL